MTLTLQLTPEQDARLRAEAEQRGLSVEDYALQRILAETGPVRRGIIGLYADEPELMDEIMEHVMEARRRSAMRPTDG